MTTKDNKPYIGVTGITCIEDVEIIKSTLEDSYGMYGVLVSENTLKMVKPHRGRYPNIDSLKEIFRAMPENALRAVHYNSRDVGNISEDVRKIVELTDGICNCVQLNIEYPPVDQVAKIKDWNKDINIIFQLGKESLGEFAYKYVTSNVKPYIPFIDYIIIDASQGAGAELKIIDTIKFAKPLSFIKPLTFAGGLNGDNIHIFISLIEEFNASIDAEGRLMNDNDNLDHDKVISYIRIAKRIRNFTYKNK